MRHLFLAAALFAAAPAIAQTPAVTVENPWARATTPSAKAGGIFLTLHGSAAADRLVSAATPVAGMAEIHRTVEQDGVMKMLPIDGIDVAPGATVEFKPGGLHIMLMGLKQQLKPGDTFPVTLTFAKAPPITATVTVGAAGAAGPAMGMHQMHMTPKP